MNEERNCHECMNFVPIGEGDHLCIAESEPRLVVAEYMPTDGFYWCDGAKFEEFPF